MDLHRIPLYRLPVNIVPLSYKLTMKPCFETFKKFESNLMIRIKVIEACNEIMLNAVKLNLKDVEFKTDNNKTMKPEKILHDEEKEMVKLFFGSKSILPTGMATLTIKFDGLINQTRELKGIYCNRWNELERKDLKEKCWIMAKLDNCQARLAMPCWDEPQFKATFKLEMELPADLDCIFNAKKEKEESMASGWKKMCFNETPLMSTSGLAFCVGKFDRTLEKDVNGIKLRICTPKTDDKIWGRKKQWAQWTEEIAAKMLDFFDKTFFGRGQMVKFPMEKLDLMAVPNLAVRGTGSLGLITLNEDKFWVNDDASPCTKKQRIALLVAKFIAKQWVGNMMTMRDWKQIWLEESLCKYLKYYAVDKLYPEWKVWDQEFSRAEMLPAMRFDMLPTTNPMEMSDEMMKMIMGGAGKSPMECMEHMKAGDWDYLEKFVRFSKGATVLKMINDYVGEMCFNKALCNFITKFCYKTVTCDDLYSELEMECKQTRPNLNIKQLMKTWAEKRGFPILHVTGKVDPATGNFMITLKQESVINLIKKDLGKMESFQHHAIPSDTSEPKLWWIPLSITTDPTGISPKMDVIMDKEMISLMIPAAEYRNSTGYFKIDPKHSCYMTVVYPEDHIRKVFLPMMERKELKDPMDRLGLVMDVFKGVKCGLYTTDMFLDLVRACCEKADEDCFAVWRCLTDCMWELRQCCADADFFKKSGKDMKLKEKFDKFARKMVRDTKKSKIDTRWWRGESKMDRMKPDEEMLAGLLAHFMVMFRDRDVEKKAVDTFWAWFHHEGEEKGRIVSGDMQKACFAAAAQTNEMKACDAFMKIYKEFKFEEAREYVLHGMGFFTEPRIIDKLIDFAMSDAVPSEDTLRMFKSMSRRYPETREAMWRMLKTKMDFFMANYDRCRFGSDFFEEFITQFCDDKMAMEICKFARDKIPIKNCTRMLQQATEYAQLKSAWFKRDGDNIKRYLDQFQ